MQKLTALQQYFEDYLKREGLSIVMPEYRRPSSLPLPVIWIWLAGLCLLEIYIILKNKGVGGLLIALSIPIVLFLGILLALIVAFTIRQLRRGETLGSQDARLIGEVIMFGYPLLVAVTIGFYLMSWSAAAWYVLLSVLSIGVLLGLQSIAFRLHLLSELASSAFRVLRQSITLLFVLVPLLLVIVGLSIFSQELWQAVGNLTAFQLLESAFFIALPTILLMLVSLKEVTIEVVGSCPSIEEVIENVENVPFFKSKIEKGLISDEEWIEARNELSSEFRKLRWPDGQI